MIKSINFVIHKNSVLIISYFNIIIKLLNEKPFFNRKTLKKILNKPLNNGQVAEKAKKEKGKNAKESP